MTGADDRPVLITGGAGFIGSNLADRIAGEGRTVIVYDALSRAGVENNLAWLQSRHGGRIEAITADIRDEDRLAAAATRAGVPPTAGPAIIRDRAPRRATERAARSAAGRSAQCLAGVGRRF